MFHIKASKLDPNWNFSLKKYHTYIWQPCSTYIFQTVFIKSSNIFLDIYATQPHTTTTTRKELQRTAVQCFKSLHPGEIRAHDLLLRLAETMTCTTRHQDFLSNLQSFKQIILPRYASKFFLNIGWFLEKSEFSVMIFGEKMAFFLKTIVIIQILQKN
jgi:hypothetical protein